MLAQLTRGFRELKTQFNFILAHATLILGVFSREL
jgi:hypothetical protein